MKERAVNCVEVQGFFLFRVQCVFKRVQGSGSILWGLGGLDLGLGFERLKFGPRVWGVQIWAQGFGGLRFGPRVWGVKIWA